MIMVDLEKPDMCVLCPFHDMPFSDSDCYCNLLDRYIERKDSRKVQDDCPIIEAEPVRHGKWIYYPDCLAYEGAISHEDFVCSECASVWNAIDNESDRFDYCPNCGARMEVEE